MSWSLCRVRTQVARKDYRCDAADCIGDKLGWDEREYEEEDRPAIHRAKEEGFKILKGSRYVKVDGVWEGEWSVFRAREDLDAICHKYEMYRE